jgi:hypothetical protein
MVANESVVNMADGWIVMTAVAEDCTLYGDGCHEEWGGGGCSGRDVITDMKWGPYRRPSWPMMMTWEASWFPDDRERPCPTGT